jgi:hypothetical protein
MIAHVAEAGEDRGRVVLHLGSSGRMSEIALEAAMRVAQAFQSEIESVFVEDRQLLDLARFPFAREIGLSGRQVRALSPGEIEHDIQVQAAALQRKVLAIARTFEVPARTRIVRDEPLRALAIACAESGPWNVVTLAEPFTGRDAAELSVLFDAVAGTTGGVLAGPKARHTKGDVVALIEDVDRVPPMLRAAERIADATGGVARLVLIDDNAERLAWMDGQVRLALGQRPAVNLEAINMSRRSMGSVAEILRRSGVGFVIARFRGRFVSGDGGLAQLAAMLEGPLFLVR